MVNVDKRPSGIYMKLQDIFSLAISIWDLNPNSSKEKKNLLTHYTFFKEKNQYFTFLTVEWKDLDIFQSGKKKGFSPFVE